MVKSVDKTTSPAVNATGSSQDSVDKTTPTFGEGGFHSVNQSVDKTTSKIDQDGFLQSCISGPQEFGGRSEWRVSRVVSDGTVQFWFTDF